MLWFLLFGTIGYIIYRFHKRRRFRTQQKEIAKYKDAQFNKLASAEKLKLRKLVNSIFNSRMTLNDETNEIVSDLYQQIEQEDFYRQGGLGLKQVSQSKNSRN